MSTANKQGPTVAERTSAARPQRVLACMLCQRRKIKCDRKSPCANCIGAGAQCVPATAAPRRRRFPERLLLERLRHYEGLLRQNNVNFEPLHPSATASQQHASASDNGMGFDSLDDARSEVSRESAEKTAVKSEALYEDKFYFPANISQSLA